VWGGGATVATFFSWLLVWVRQNRVRKRFCIQIISKDAESISNSSLRGLCDITAIQLVGCPHSPRHCSLGGCANQRSTFDLRLDTPQEHKGLSLKEKLNQGSSKTWRTPPAIAVQHRNACVSRGYGLALFRQGRQRSTRKFDYRRRELLTQATVTK
jgi:hypothetical protein